MTDRQYARKRPEPQLAWHVINFHTRGLNTKPIDDDGSTWPESVP